jgi:antagonist of KipI
LPEGLIPRYGNEVSLRVLLGPQDDLFTEKGITTLLSSAYTISSEADRMGYRLEGAKIQHTGKADIVSDALCQGAIQVPGHGMPIVMMADRATTGGYTKIGTVIGSDLTKMAQAKPGDTVRFTLCSDAEAVAALRAEQEIYVQVVEISKVRATPADNLTGQGRRFTVSVNGQTYDIQIEER